MTRLLRLCLLTYPRAVRRADGDHLLGLALDLADSSGPTRQALSLLRGGTLARLDATRPVHAIAAGGVAVGLALGGTALAGPTSQQVEVLSCSGSCDDVRAWAQDREDQGWTCAQDVARGTAQWQCVAP